MKRPDVFTELEAAAVGCIALEGTCIRSAYVHDLYVLICDYKGVTVYVVVPDSFNRYAVLRRVLGHQLRFIPIVERMADPNKEQRRSDPRPTSDSLFREAFGLNRRKE